MDILKSRRAPHACLATLLALLGAAVPLQGAGFQSITPAGIATISSWFWTNPELEVTAISGDGHTIAGRIWNTGVDYDCAKNICGVAPFVWSLNDSSARSMLVNPIPLHLGSYKSNAYPVLATALTRDGKDALVVSENGYLESAIYRDSQPELLRPSIDPKDSLWASGMSADGKAVVGNIGAQPFVWRESVGLQSITGLPSGFAFSADAISSDGQVVVLNGQPSSVDGAWSTYPRASWGNAFHWEAATGLTELPPLPGDDYSHGTASSLDGATIVGNSVTMISPFTYENRAMRWSEGVSTELDAPVGFSFWMAEDVSGDGKVVVGSASDQAEHWPFKLPDPASDWFNFGSSFATTERAMIWDADGQVFDMKVFLETRHGLGSQLAGWLLTDATAISDDGSVIAGRGIDPAGKSAIWIAELTIPEPTSLVIAIAAIILLATPDHRARRC